MIQYQSVNVKLANSQLEKLKLATKNETGVTLISNHQKWLVILVMKLIFDINYY